MAKKTYDLCPNSRGCAEPWSYGFHEKTHHLVYGSHTPFPAEDYTTVECPRAIYRIHKRDLNDWQIQDFLRRAKLLSPLEVNTDV